MNEAPVVSTICGTPLGGIDFVRYVSSFAGAYFLDPLPLIESLPSSETAQSTAARASLCPEGYCRFLVDYTLDTQAQTLQIQDYNLYNVSLKSVDSVRNVYELNVPGLREGTPRVAIGDIILLRQLSINPATKLPWAILPQDVPEGQSDLGRPCPGFTGYQMVPTIWGIDKNRELLLIQCNGMKAAFPACNIRFVVQPRRTSAIQRAIQDVSAGLRISPGGDSVSTNWLRCMLFPAEVNGVYRKSLPTGVFKESWFDNSLNYEQQVSR